MDDAIENYAAKLLAETREEVVRADTKAEILFAAFGVVVAAVLAGLIAGDWSPEDLGRVATVIFWMGSGCASASFLALGYALWPRIRHEEADGSASYYAHVHMYEDLNALRTALKQGAESGGRTVEQLKVVSDIAWSKYVGIRLAMALYGFGVTACAGAAIFG
ncbi:MAG: Pycsar system effector family protein [Solirubrobacteraceae bacterium]